MTIYQNEKVLNCYNKPILISLKKASMDALCWFCSEFEHAHAYVSHSIELTGKYKPCLQY